MILNFRAILTLSIFLMVACTHEKNKGKDMTQVTPLEAVGQVRNSFGVIVDVREIEELREEGTAQGARHIPVGEIEGNTQVWKDFKKTLKPEEQIIFYCKAGGRAKRAAVVATKEGLKAANMGGFSAWVAAGLPVSKVK